MERWSSDVRIFGGKAATGWGTRLAVTQIWSVARAVEERIRRVDSQHDQGYIVEEYARGEADLVM